MLTMSCHPHHQLKHRYYSCHEPHQNPTKSKTIFESWEENGVARGNIMENNIVKDYKNKLC